MTRTRRLVGTVVIICGLTATLAAAEPERTPSAREAEEAEVAAAYVARLGRAYKLIEFGRKQKSPEALLMAATILRQIPPLQSGNTRASPNLISWLQGCQAEVAEVRGFKRESEELKKEALALVLFEDKKAGKKILAGDDPKVRELAEQLDRMPLSRQVKGGPQMVCRLLAPGATATYKFTLIPYHKACMTIRANGEVLVSVHRPDQSTIVQDTCTVGVAVWWVPANRDWVWTITVENVTKQAVRYTLYVN